MASYLHPGVYIEEIPSGAKPIEGVSTSVAAFVGAASRGPAGEAKLIGKWDDYASDYGGVTSENDAMGLAVQSFYLNGGGAAYICRLTGDNSNAAAVSFNGQGPAGGVPTADPVLIVTANSVGDWGNDVYVQINKPDQDSLTFDLLVGHREEGEFVEDESFTGLSMREDDNNYALLQVNGNSSYVELSLGAAAEIGGASEQYKNAVLTGGELETDANYFSDRITDSMTLTLNINELGAEQITIDVGGDLGNGQADDGDTVANAIRTAVDNLGTEAVYNNFACSYDEPNRRFVLTSAEVDSNASLEVYGGDLAQILRLDSSNRSVLTGTSVNDAADYFSVGIPLLDSTTLTLNIDDHGDQTIELDVNDLVQSLDGGSNQADGAAVALAIQNAVRAFNPAVEVYKNFTCEYNTSRQFELTSRSGNSRRAGLSVNTSELATFLELTGVNAVPGRQLDQGTANVIPVNSLGPLDTGEQLTNGYASAPAPIDYMDFYNTILRKVRDVSIIVLPGEQWAEDGSGNPVVSNTLAHCTAMQNRMVIIDSPVNLELEQAANVTQMALPTSTYSVLYYPWIKVANPFYNVDTNPNASKTLNVAPSAAAAGMWAKIDSKRGVWKAPAGVEAQLNGVAGLAYNVEDLEQDQLNPLGVNCIRKLPNFGSVFWGSRTLATKADPEWRYVPVRRTAIFIEQSIYQGIQWAVFEPNDHPLWGSLRVNISTFMNGLFRSGAFQGATADDAYFVRCGLSDTMTQGDIDRGQVIVIVGFAPLKPAEFVIVRIQQKVGQQ